MTKNEKNEAIFMQTVGYYSGYGGIEVKYIIYGIDDIVLFTAGTFCGKPSAHRAKIHYDTDRPYFIYAGRRIHFDEILRA